MVVKSASLALLALFVSSGGALAGAPSLSRSTPKLCAKTETIDAEGQNPNIKAAFLGEVDRIKGGPDRGALALGLSAANGNFWLKSLRTLKGPPVKRRGPFKFSEINLDDGQVSGHAAQIGERYLASQGNDGIWGAVPLCEQPP